MRFELGMLLTARKKLFRLFDLEDFEIDSVVNQEVLI
jgi:hypothetical protein